MPLDLRTYPEDDSPDLTDSEIEGAISTDNPKDFGDKLALIYLSCGSCKGPVTKTHSSLLRRKPSVFSRTETTCVNGHTERITYRIDWIIRGTHG